MAYLIHLIPGLNYVAVRRAVVFLECLQDKSIDAKKTFYAMKEKHRNEMLGRFELWQRGGVQDKYFHGFGGDHRNCFVFKRKQAGTYYRYYGFLIHPRIGTDAGFLVCVLASHAIKNTTDTDPAELNGMIILRNQQQVVEAVKRAFPE
jgi:hypothetical protein